jgi:hypothetical protein
VTGDPGGALRGEQHLERRMQLPDSRMELYESRCSSHSPVVMVVSALLSRPGERCEFRTYLASDLAVAPRSRPGPGRSAVRVESPRTAEAITLLPLVKRLPRRIDRLTSALEHGRLSVNIRLFADNRDRTLITGLLLTVARDATRRP